MGEVEKVDEGHLPQGVADSAREEFAMYLEARANEPCGRSVPSSIYKTLLFMEAAGEFPVEEQLGRTSSGQERP